MIAYKKLESGDERWLMKVNQTFRGCQISEEKAEAVLQDKKIRVYIAYEADTVCAYTLAYVLPRIDNGNAMLLIYHLFVEEAYQRRHIGETLMKIVLEEAKAEHLHYMFLITQDDNEAANALYQKAGGELHTHNKNIYYWYGSGKPQV